MAVAPQEFTDQTAYFGIVVYDENFGHGRFKIVAARTAIGNSLFFPDRLPNRINPQSVTVCRQRVGGTLARFLTKIKQHYKPKNDIFP
jgi:hypothetical protein